MIIKTKFFLYIKLFIVLWLIFSVPIFCEYKNLQNKFLRTYKISVLDFFNNEFGKFEIIISTISTNKSKPEYCYKAEIYTSVNLSLLFFPGKSTSSETEFYDANFVPLESELMLKSEKDTFTTKYRGYKIQHSSYSYEGILTMSSLKGKERKKIIKFSPPVITAGNVIPIILTNDVTKVNKYSLQLIEKGKLELKKFRSLRAKKSLLTQNSKYLTHN